MHINVKFFGKTIEGAWYPEDMTCSSIKISICFLNRGINERKVVIKEEGLNHLIETFNSVALKDKTYPFTLESVFIKNELQYTYLLKEMNQLKSQIEATRFHYSLWEKM